MSNYNFKTTKYENKNITKCLACYNNNGHLCTNKNQQNYELLKKNNVTVFFDESQTFTHGKALVIDNNTVLLGSSNWSKSALTRNNETNVLIRSEVLAQEIVKNLNQIKLQENVPAILTPSISIPKEFLTNKKLLGEMASSSDITASLPGYGKGVR